MSSTPVGNHKGVAKGPQMSIHDGEGREGLHGAQLCLLRLSVQGET